MTAALVGAFLVSVVLLVVVIIDLLRSHGRILRVLHEVDPQGATTLGAVEGADATES